MLSIHSSICFHFFIVSLNTLFLFYLILDFISPGLAIVPHFRSLVNVVLQAGSFSHVLVYVHVFVFVYQPASIILLSTEEAEKCCIFTKSKRLIHHQYSWDRRSRSSLEIIQYCPISEMSKTIGQKRLINIIRVSPVFALYCLSYELISRILSGILLFPLIPLI